MSTSLKMRPGRPLAYSVMERRRLILAAAERVFVEQGYGASTMEEIARAAEMSKKTLYQFFSDKAAVFSELMQSEEMPEFPEIVGEGEGPASPALLRDTLVTVTRFILDPRHVALTRLVIAEAPNYPELATSFYNNYIERFKMTLRDRLQELERAGVAGAASAVAMADPLMGATIGSCHMMALLRCQEFTSDDVEARVALAMKLIGIECTNGRNCPGEAGSEGRNRATGQAIDAKPRRAGL